MEEENPNPQILRAQPQNPESQTTLPSPSPPRGNGKIIIGCIVLFSIFLVILFSIIGTKYFLLKSDENKNHSNLGGNSETSSFNQENLAGEQETPPNIQDQGDYLVLYIYTSGIAQKNTDSKTYISDIFNQNRREISNLVLNSYPVEFSLSPNGKYLAKIDRKTIEIANRDNFSSFNKIVDLPQDSSIFIPDNNIVWSQDDSKLAYEVRSYTSVDYYTVNIDGSDLKIIGKQTGYSGGTFLGFNPAKNELYFTENNFSNKKTAYVRMNTNDSSVQELFSLQMDEYSVFLNDFSKFYYIENSTIIEYNPSDMSKRPVYTINASGVGSSSLTESIRVSPNGEFLVLVSFEGQKKNKKQIISIKDAKVDSFLADPQFDEYFLSTRTPISPDGRFIFISKSSEYKPETTSLPGNPYPTPDYSYYSGRQCLVDLKTRKIIPFFNCSLGKTSHEDSVNENIGFFGWIKK